MLTSSSSWHPGTLAHRPVLASAAAMLTSSSSWQPRSLARRLISGIYKQQCLHHPAPCILDHWPIVRFRHLQQQCLHHPAFGILDPWPIGRFLASAPTMLTSSSFWHSRSLAHRPVSGNSKTYIIKLLASEPTVSWYSSWCLESRRSITEVGKERGGGEEVMKGRLNAE
jgi:hypothetical protein